MNFKTVKSLFKKEILDVLRDKKTIIMMVLVPLILYPLLVVAGLGLMTKISTDMSTQEYRVAMCFNDDRLSKMLLDKDEGYSLSIVNVDNADEALARGEIDAYLRKEFTHGKENIVVSYLSADTESGYAVSIITDILERYSLSLTTELIEEAGMSPDKVLNPIRIVTKDHSSKEESAGNILGNLIPFMLVVSLLMGTMYPAIDTTAGERERGTLETILTLPVSNQELFFSKFLTVATIGIASALLNIISMGGVGIYMYKTVMSVGGGTGIDLKQFVPGIIIAVLCVLAFAVFISAISMCVCVFAKSYKEANNYITPLTLVVMFASMVSIVPNVKLNAKMAMVPVVNICLLIRELMVFKFDIFMITLVLVSNIILGVLAVLLLGKIYNSEAILFGESGGSVQIFEKRCNMIKGGVPNLGDMFLVMSAALVAMIYVGGTLQLKLGYYGVLGTQLIISLVPILYALYTKKDMKKTFRLRAPAIKNVLGGALIIAGTILIGLIITAISGSVFRQSSSDLSESMNSLLGDSFIETLLVVAVAPAICEELMFRGFVFSALEKRVNYKKAIIISGVIFGAYHMNIVQFFTTAFIGMAICYVTYKSESIIPGMIMHFLNNGLSCFAMYYPQTLSKIMPFLTKEALYLSDILCILLIGFLFIGLGKIVINLKGEK